jgi:amino acid transporter
VYRSFSDAVGVFYVDTANWDPFAPNGVKFWKEFQLYFCLYRFDAISTTAEECKDPQRDFAKEVMLLSVPFIHCNSKY